MATAETTLPARKKGLAPKIRKLSLQYPEMTQSDIARKVGCTTSNVSQVLKNFLDGCSSDDLLDFQTNKAEVYDALQKRILESVTHAKLEKVAVRDAVVAAAILQDKSQVLRGQATGINVVALLDVVKAIKESELRNPQAIRSSSAHAPQTLDAQGLDIAS
jgi:predicted XRE-type DNA-binding protein